MIERHIARTKHFSRPLLGVVRSRRSKTWAIIGEKGKIRHFHTLHPRHQKEQTGVISFGISVPS
nr:MAG TPA: hypothetical protein [Caudoviricetes sp.]